MLIKRRPPQFIRFVENKYRPEHVMITILYIVSHVLHERDGLAPRRPVKGTWHDQIANSSWYAAIVLLEEKIVSNILIDLQEMWVKDFIHISLACEWPCYYANSTNLIQSSGWHSFLAWVYTSYLLDFLITSLSPHLSAFCKSTSGIMTSIRRLLLGLIFQTQETFVG